MRNISQLVASMMLLATQAYVPFVGTDADAAAQTQSAPSAYEVKLNTNTADPIEISGQNQPDFNTEVLAPLRVAQAQEAERVRVAAEQAAKAKAEAEAKAKAEAAATAKAKLASTQTAVVTVSGSDAWAQLRLCEAGGNYARNSGNGYYGAYQFDIRTWGNYGGYARPDLAPPAVQDAKAQATQAARGWSPWPACARKLGLL